MNTKEQNTELSERVEQEHEHLRKELEELTSFSSASPSGDDFYRWRLELIWKVRDFKNDLLKHFDLEEEGGFMRDVRRIVPNSDPQVKKLLAEHREMEGVVDGILAQLKSMVEEDDGELGRLRLNIENLVSTILDHESTERHLIQRTYYRDYGGTE